MTIGSQYDFRRAKTLTDKQYSKLLEVAAENYRKIRERAQEEEAIKNRKMAERRREIQERREVKEATGWLFD